MTSLKFTGQKSYVIAAYIKLHLIFSLDYDIDDINAIIESVHANGLNWTDSVHEYEICKLLFGVKKTAPGADNIPYWVFKHRAVELACVIANLVNKKLSIGRPSSAWKNALVTPIPKVSSVKSFTDPVSYTHLTLPTKRIV